MKLKPVLEKWLLEAGFELTKCASFIDQPIIRKALSRLEELDEWENDNGFLDNVKQDIHEMENEIENLNSEVLELEERLASYE